VFEPFAQAVNELAALIGYFVIAISLIYTGGTVLKKCLKKDD